MEWMGEGAKAERATDEREARAKTAAAAARRVSQREAEYHRARFRLHSAPGKGRPRHHQKRHAKGFVGACIPVPTQWTETSSYKLSSRT